MRVRLRLDRSSLRGWHGELIRQLEACPGTVVEIEHRATPASQLPKSAERLLGFEGLIHGSRADWATLLPDRWPERASSSGVPDRVIDLSGETGPNVWTLLFDGAPGEIALFTSLIQGRSPVAEIRDGERLVAAGRLGTESPGNLRASFSDALARTATLIAAALNGAPSDHPMVASRPPHSTPADALPNLGITVACRLTDLARNRLRRLRRHHLDWRVGWRRLSGPDLFDLHRHPDGGWTDLPDDGRRFFADPFPLEHDGQVHLFVEEYPRATGKGIISAVRFGPHGPEGAPRPVLEMPHHLSYPFVFARDGDVWMVPESSGAGTVDLFRATRFPGGWVREATLIEGVAASDATLVEHGGLWWLFATVRGEGGSSSDALHLWSAPDFRGPWTPHARNPVLIDSASARPAGRIVVRDGVLWRPVQDCRETYGGALGLARILALGPDGFAQRVEVTLRPGPQWPGHLLHTVNRAGAFEFIDGAGYGRRLPFRNGAALPRSVAKLGASATAA